MDVEITPEPSEEERQAIVEAFKDERTRPAGRPRWWVAGLAPEEGDDQPATAPRRQSRGATRA